jgi:hypothetical protein
MRVLVLRKKVIISGGLAILFHPFFYLYAWNNLITAERIFMESDIAIT